MAAEPEQVKAGRHDSAERRQATRTQREKGCWVYIPAEELVRAGFSVFEPPPFYRTWGRHRTSRSGSVIINLYREK